MIDTKQGGRLFGTVMTVELVKNDLTFEVGRVFLLCHRNEEPLLVGCPTFGVHFKSGRWFFIICSTDGHHGRRGLVFCRFRLGSFRAFPLQFIDPGLPFVMGLFLPL